MGELFAGRYELVDPLGQGGGLGSVWRAWDHKRQEYTAAKVLRHSDAAALLRFVREQSYLVDHPNVVVPIGWAGEGDRVLFTMRMVCGGSTETLLDAYGMLPPEWVAVLLDQLLSALEALHALGIVHRDLKPANLLLEPTGPEQPQLRVSDFGIATQLGQPRLTRASLFVGTPGYLAPEQAGGADPDPRQDLFACGAVAAELLRGRSPATPDGVPAPLEQEAPLGVPAPLWEVLRRLAARDPDERPADAQQARHELARSRSVPSTWVADGGVQVTDHTPPYPPDWGPDGPIGEPRVLTRGGTGVPAAVFHRRAEIDEVEEVDEIEHVEEAVPEPVEVPEVIEEPEPEPEPEIAELPELEPQDTVPAPPEPEPEDDEPEELEPEPSFRAETPVEELLDEPEPEPEPELEPPARGPWATEPEWSPEPAAERERPEPRPPVPSRFATPAPERRPPMRPTRQGPQPRPQRPPADTPARRDRTREPVQQSGPMWAGDRPQPQAQQRPPRRGRRVVRALAIFATIIGAMLLLTAVALIFFR